MIEHNLWEYWYPCRFSLTMYFPFFVPKACDAAKYRQFHQKVTSGSIAIHASLANQNVNFCHVFQNNSSLSISGQNMPGVVATQKTTLEVIVFTIKNTCYSQGV